MSRTEHPILAIQNLRKDFKRTTVLDGIDMVIDEPGVYGFIGPNGAGKTTTFKLISGLLRASGGRVLIDGADVQREPLRAVSKLGVQFDGPVFYPYLSGRDNLRVIARWLGLEPGAGIDGLLSTVGLEDAADRREGEYSWGMKRRLGLAAALLNEPELLLLDEPTNGLDPGGIADVRRLLPELAQKGRCVFLSSHRMDELEKTCDHVTIIHHGKIVAAGKPENLATEGNLVEIQCEKAAAAASILGEISDVIAVKQTAADRIEVLAPKLRASRINQFLIDQGITADQIVVRRETLEDVFFRLTGQTGNNDGSAKEPAGEGGRE